MKNIGFWLKILYFAIESIVVGFTITGIIVITFILSGVWKIEPSDHDTDYDGKCTKVEVYDYQDGKMTNMYSEVVFSDYIKADHINDGFGERIVIYFENKEEGK